METKRQTAVQWLTQRYHERQGYLSQEDLQNGAAMEQKQLKDGMMYALDEDGHTGDWKQRFVNTYYEQMYEKP